MADQRDMGTIWSSVGLDYRPFEMGIAHVQRRIRELDVSNQAHFDELARTWSQVGHEMPRPFDVATTQIESHLGDLVAASTAGARRIEQAWEQTGSGLYVPFGESAGRIETSADRVQGSIREVARATEEVANATRRTGDVVEQTTSDMGRHWQRLGTVMSISVTAPLTIAGTQMVRTLSEFSASMARTAAVSQATRAEWEQMTVVARELGATTRYSASEAAEGMTYLAMAGFSVNQTIEAMPGVLQLAASAQLDLATAADITTNILTGYGLAVEDLARVNDVLVSAMTGANTNLQQLGEAMKYAGPVASAAGVSFEEAAAAIALMSNAGIQGSMAGTSLRGAITRLLNPTKENADLIRQLGLNIYDTNGNLRSLVEIIEELERAQVSAGDMMQLFGQRAGPAMQALVEQGSRALREFNQRLLESEGIAARVARMQEDTIQGSLLELESAFEEVTLSLTTSVEPALRLTFDTLAEVLRMFAALPPPVQQGTVAFLGVTAAAGPLILAFRGIVTAAAPLIGPAGIVLGIAAALGMLATAFGYVSESARRTSGVVAESMLQQARATRQQADELDRLVREYERLSGKPELSREEHDRLQRVMNEIVRIQPDIAAGYRDIGQAIQENLDPLREYIQLLRTQSDTYIEVAAARAEMELPRLELEREQLLAEIERLRAEKDDRYQEEIQAIQRFTEAQRLVNQALRDADLGVPYDEAFEAFDRFMAEVFGFVPPNRVGALAALEEEADAASRTLGRTLDQLEAAEARLQQIEEEIQRLRAALEAYDRIRQGLSPFPEETVEPPAQRFLDVVEEAVDAQESALQQEIRIWRARVAAAREGTEEQRRVIEAFLEWVNRQVTQLESGLDVDILDLEGQILEDLSTLVPLQTQLSSVVEEMGALDEITRVTSQSLEEIQGEESIDRWRRQIEVLSQQRAELEALQERAAEMGVVGESAARAYRQAIAELSDEIRFLERDIQEYEKAAEDAAERRMRAQELAARELQRQEEARIQRRLRELELEQEIRRILGDPITPSEELYQLQRFLEELRERASMEIEFEFVVDGETLRGSTRALAEDFVANLEQRIQDEISLVEARLTIAPTATLTLGPVAAILDEYERRLAVFERASRIVEDFNYLEVAINLTNQTLMRLAEEGLDESSEAVQQLRARLEQFQTFASLYERIRPRLPEPISIVELDPIDRRLEEMNEALRQVEVQALAFGESFDTIAAKAQVVRAALNDIIRLGVDPADARFRRLVSILQIYEMEVGPVTRVLNELSEQLAMNSRMAQALGDSFDRNRADASAYQRALERLARESLWLTGEELQNAAFWMQYFGEQIRSRTEDVDRFIQVQKRLGASLIDVVRSRGQSLGSFFGQVWETAKEEGVGFFDAFGMAMLGIFQNTGQIVTFVIEGIVESFQAVHAAYDRIDQRAHESFERTQDLRQRFEQLARAGFQGVFELDAREIREKVEGGLLTNLGQFFGVIPREVSRTIYEVSATTEEWIERMERLYRDAAETGRSALREAFEDPEVDFLISLRMNVYDHVRDGLIDAFSESQLYMRAMAPLFQAIDQGLEEAFAGGTFDETVFNRIVDPAIARWEQDVAALERPFETIQQVLSRIRDTLDIPGPEESQTPGSSGGVRLTNLTGASRDFLAEHLRPLRMLDLAPLWHDQHMARLDVIISLLRSDGEMEAQFRAFLEVQQATLNSETVIVEVIQSATFTGNVFAQIGEEDAREVIRQLMERYGFGGNALARAQGN